MIVLIAQMWPRGDAEKAYEIGRAYVANVGGDATRGDYQVAVCRRGSNAVPAPIDPAGPKATRTGEVKGYPRLAYNQWRLQIRALLACFPEEATHKLLGDVAALQDLDIGSEPTDEQATELGREIVNAEQESTLATGCAAEGHAAGLAHGIVCAVGREAWRRGARPRGF